MVGAAGFELATLCSQSRCATRLRYAPTNNILTLKRRILGAEAKKVTYFEKLACAWGGYFALPGVKRDNKEERPAGAGRFSCAQAVLSCRALQAC